MAHLRKVGSGWQLQYYLNGRRLVKQFPKEVPKAVVEAERKRIESELALHKAGLKRFGENPRAAEFLTLHDLTESALNSRQHEVTKETIARNRHAMKLFLAVIGKHTLVSDLKPTHFDKFRHARFEAMQKLYRARVSMSQSTEGALLWRNETIFPKNARSMMPNSNNSKRSCACCVNA